MGISTLQRIIANLPDTATLASGEIIPITGADKQALGCAMYANAAIRQLFANDPVKIAAPVIQLDTPGFINDEIGDAYFDEWLTSSLKQEDVPFLPEKLTGDAPEVCGLVMATQSDQEIKDAEAADKLLLDGLFQGIGYDVTKKVQP